MKPVIPCCYQTVSSDNFKWSDKLLITITTEVNGTLQQQCNSLTFTQKLTLLNSSVNKRPYGPFYSTHLRTLRWHIHCNTLTWTTESSFTHTGWCWGFQWGAVLSMHGSPRQQTADWRTEDDLWTRKGSGPGCNHIFKI